MDRKSIKKKARKNLGQNYWRAVIVCFISLIIINEGYQLFSVNINSNDLSLNTNNLQILNNILNDYITNSDINKGILAIFASSIESANSFLIGLLNGLNQILFHNQIANGVIIFIGIIISIIFLLFISNIVQIGRNRFFLEKINHRKTPVDRIFYIFRIKKTIHTAGIMFFQNLYLFLWAFTIIGGIIKHYSYLMIPYILAENPSISKKEAFMLSKKMMDGRKWECFKLDVSFIFYKILDLLTFRITRFLITEPYYQMTYANVYMDIRQNLKTDDNFNKYFMDTLLDAESSIYPEILVRRNTRKWLKFDYNIKYNISTLILIFFTIAMIGWMWEVFLNFFRTGEFVNKGTLFGPWLPIYGTGGVLLLIFLSRFREKPILVFLLSLVICGSLEYIVSFYLETVYQLKWWDYTGFFLNINGRICLEVLIIFGLSGLAIIYFFAPLANNIYKKIPQKIKIIICIILIVLFVTDFTISTINPNHGEGITTVAML